MSKQQSVTQKQQMFVECLSQFIRATKYSIVDDGYYKTHETVNGFIGCKDEIAAHHSGFIEPYLDTYKTARSSYLPRSLCPPPAPAAGPLRVSGEPEVRCFLTIFSMSPMTDSWLVYNFSIHLVPTKMLVFNSRRRTVGW